MNLSEFTQDDTLQGIAKDLIYHVERVGHVELNSVLFLREMTTAPNALARCYKIHEHPIKLFTEANWCIVVYDQNVNYMTHNQLQILVLHELMHIAPLGDKIIDHDVKDFRPLLGIDLDWSKPNQKVPDVLTL